MGHAFAIDDVNAQNMRGMNEWLAMDESQSVAQLRRAQNTYQGIPFTYTIASDSIGQAYFADASVVPEVTDAEAARCVDTPQGKAEFPDTFILDGSTSSCGWGNDPTADPARHLRAGLGAAADQHVLRGQLQQHAVAGQREHADHQLPGHLRRRSRAASPRRGRS